MQGALQCAFPEMAESEAVWLSEILRGKGRGGEEASENQVDSTCEVTGETEWLQQLETYKGAAELPGHLFDDECVPSLARLELNDFSFVKLPEREQNLMLSSHLFF